VPIPIYESSVGGGGGGAGVGGASPGDRKWSDRSIDHGDWILLDARPLTSLTLAQLNVATSLGYVGNLPEMRGKFPLGASSVFPLLSSGGASSATIAQANLPAISIVGGNHAHAVSDSGHNHPSWIGSGGQTLVDNNGTGGNNSGFQPTLSGSTNQRLQTGNASTGISIGSSGNISIPLGGAGSPLAVLNPYSTGNWFVWLGTASNTVTVVQPLSVTTSGAGNATFDPVTGVLNIPSAVSSIDSIMA
jgi:hypothetical protein